MDCGMPGFPALHYLPEFTQIHVHWVSDASSPSHPLSPSSPFAFEFWCWRRILRVSWTTGRSNQSILKEINPEYSLEGLMLQLNLQNFGHLMRRTDSLEKTLDAGKDWRQEEKGTTEDEMVGWHHQLNGHELEQAPGVGDGQGGLACCSPRRVRRNWTELNENNEHNNRSHLKYL